VRVLTLKSRANSAWHEGSMCVKESVCTGARRVRLLIHRSALLCWCWCRSMDGGTVRNMDWIYRNIPGAKVERRTHQSLNVPEQPGQTVYQTLIDLEVQVLPSLALTLARALSPSLTSKCRCCMH
jgi:hypothetical protein